MQTSQVIFSYSRAQAIEDGTLVDLMQDAMTSVCKQHFKFPIACTSAVFAIMQSAVENENYCNDYAGILHDMLWMSKVCGRSLNPSTRIFTVIIKGAGRKSKFTFKIVCGPGDQAEPVLTIMLPTED